MKRKPSGRLIRRPQALWQSHYSCERVENRVLLSTVYDNFNSGPPSFASFYTDYQVNNVATAGNPYLSYASAGGISDGQGGTAGGAVQSAGGTTDETAIYTPTTINLSDGATHTISEFFTAAAGLTSSDKVLQLGFISSSTGGFNAGFDFISARVFGDHAVEFQSNNGGTAASLDHTAATGTIAAGDWCQLIFNTRETASGSFTGTFSLVDYGPKGISAPTTVLGPVAYSVGGLPAIGTGSAMYPGFRTATTNHPTTPIDFDNFSVDPTAAKLAYLQQPSSGTTGSTLGSFVVAVQDINGNVVPGDSSNVTLRLDHGTFANGQSTVTAPAVDGVATFSNLVIKVAGSYVLQATDTNANLSAVDASVMVNGASQIGFVEQPQTTLVGSAIAPAVTVAVEDQNGNTVGSDSSTITLTLNGGVFSTGQSTVTARDVSGVATFGSLLIPSTGSYSLTASDASVSATTITSNTFSIVPESVMIAVSGVSPAASGQAVTFKATVTAVTPGTTVPTGTVQFSVDGTNVGSPVTLASGVATSAPVSNLPVGDHSITASYTSNSQNIASNSTSTTFTQIISGSPDLVAFVEQPLSTGVGIVQSPAVTVDVEDSSGNVSVGDSSSTVTLMLSSGTFSGGSSTVTAMVTSGAATFSNLSIGTAGTYSVTASDGSLTTATSNSFIIGAAGTEVKLAFIQQPTSVQTGNLMSPSVTVAVEDYLGHTITADSTTYVTLTLNDGQEVDSEPVTSGIATFSELYIYDRGGTYTMTATDGSLAPVVSNSFVLTDTAYYLNFNQGPSEVALGQPISPPITVDVIGYSGYTVPTDSSTVTLTLSSGTFSTGKATATAVASSGEATFSNLIINTPGLYTLSASDGSLYGTSSGSFSVDVPPTTSIDDDVYGTGVDQIDYVGSWTTINSPFPGTYGPTITDDNAAGDIATMNFSGVGIQLYSATESDGGYAFISIDSGQPDATSADVDMYSIAGAGDQLVYTSPTLPPGPHTITIINDGTQDPASSGVVISIDRFVVDRAVPIITWPTPADINYGTLLSSTQLNATATYNGMPVPGTFTYSPAAGTELSGGLNALTTQFIPTDIADYASGTDSVYLNVDLPATTTTVTSSANPSVPGQGVTFTATVTAAPGYGVPDGYIYFYVDGNYFDYAYLGATGVGTSPPDTGLTLGSHQVVADYYSESGDFAYSDNSADPLNEQVVVSMPSEVGFAQPIIGATPGKALSPVTVAVEDQGGNVLSGNLATVTLSLSQGAFAGGATSITAVTSGGVATFNNVVVNTVGTYTLSASAAGLAPGTSNGFMIYPAAALTTIDDSTVGTGFDQVAYVGVWGLNTNTAIPGCYDNTTTIDDGTGDTATVKFSGSQIIYYASVKNNRGLGSVSVDGGIPTIVDEFADTSIGQGSVIEYVSPILTPGTHTLVITNLGEYDSNPDAVGTYVTTDRFDVIMQPTATIVLPQPPGPITYDGQSDELNWVQPSITGVKGIAAPTGIATLVYYSGNAAAGTPITSPPVNAGTYTVVAMYPGDAIYAAAQSNAVTFTINQALPVVTLATPPATITADGSGDVTAWVNATVTGPAGAPAPGAAAFSYYAGTTATGAPLSSPPIAAGTYTVVASYAGNSNYLPASAGASFTINPSVGLTTTILVNGVPSTGGISNTQRAQVTSLVINFSAPVTLGAGAFSLTDQDPANPFGGAGAAVPFYATPSNGGATYTLTFAGAAFINRVFLPSSLPDGHYVLSVNFSNVACATAAVPTGVQTLAFHRLYGDLANAGYITAIAARADASAADWLNYAQYLNDDGSGSGGFDAADTSALQAAEKFVTGSQEQSVWNQYNG